MQKKDFLRIIEASKKNALTFFVGAGVSAVSNAPTWKALIDSFCVELGIPSKSSYSSDDYLSIPQKYFYSIKKDSKKYYDHINKLIPCENLAPNNVHKLMCALKPQSFVTTNFDDLLEKAVVQSYLSYKSVACEKDVSTIDGDRFILKLHGDLKHKNIVLKEEDYLNYSENFRLIETLLKSIFATNTVIFIGYGLNDYNIKLILNWAKHLLDESFNKPIFIYTDNDALTPVDVMYQDSRGLSVIDFRSCLDASDYSKVRYAERYCSVLSHVISCGKFGLDGTSKEEHFNDLYTLVAPLDKLSALRPEDIKKKLYPHATVDDVGIIYGESKKPDIFECFFELRDRVVFENAHNDVQEKYKCIESVLNKAVITAYKPYVSDPVTAKDETIWFDNIYYLFDPLCISFNYIEMDRQSYKTPKSLIDRYKKAFYLFKLSKFEDSFSLLKEVTMEAYAESNFLLYYFAQINRLNVYRTLKYLNRSIMYNNNYIFDEYDKMDLENSANSALYEDMPLEFKNNYNFLSNLPSPEFLYHNIYESLVTEIKLEKSITNRTMEFGITSLYKVVSHIRNLLHFALGNHLLIDHYHEFRMSMQQLMTAVLHKYSSQTSIRLNNDGMFQNLNSQPFALDELDFYCLVEYFDSKQIDELMDKYGIKTLDFIDINIVDNNLFNIFDYYSKILSSSASATEVFPYQKKMKTCMKLMRYFSASQKTVKKVVEILLKHEFREILIDEKILFLDSQTYVNNLDVKIIRNIVENALIAYINKLADSYKTGSEFVMLSTNGNLSFWDLANYLTPKNERYISRRLSHKISELLEKHADKLNYKSMCQSLPVITQRTKKELVSTIHNKIENDFNFNLFTLLVIYDIKILRNEIDALKLYLHNKYKNGPPLDNPGFSRYPKEAFYSDIKDVGIWCAVNILPKNEFSEFLGKSDFFDFFYDFGQFNYEKFDIAWLANFNRALHKEIAKSMYVREQIRSIVLNHLKTNEFEKRDKDRLISLLINHYN